MTIRKSTNRLTWMRILLCSFLLAGAVCACEEVEEASEYENWEERNAAFIDSIASLAGDRIVTYTGKATLVDDCAIGDIFAIQTTASTEESTQYVYCKKLSEKEDGERPLYTSSVNVFYYGTYITGDSFDSNFTGYSATDTDNLDPDDQLPTLFESPTTFTVSSTITGWTAALQYMREGERWMLYVPYQSAYGTSGSGSIPGYSALTFDVILESIN